jgi:hypothetical protein
MCHRCGLHLDLLDANTHQSERCGFTFFRHPSHLRFPLPSPLPLVGEVGPKARERVFQRYVHSSGSGSFFACACLMIDRTRCRMGLPPWRSIKHTSSPRFVVFLRKFSWLGDFVVHIRQSRASPGRSDQFTTKPPRSPSKDINIGAESAWVPRLD